ncbi:sugar kinase [Deinococcus aquiradiocola]|uniref:Fructokinase-like protein n=1 Tax=Deinococcus aquiradiocola TaxID=393059 RepID=A0A917ULC3_9DEIO|nr:sugar kinase [Deinococcus aquiradiocola]GGJ66360.1 fructokinase-like protein [Deinococcus aquiradiocola]
MTLPLPGPRPLDLTGLGEGMVELRADQPLGEAPHLTRASGGDVLNALVSAARLGSRCAFITHVGDDPFGAALRRSWQDEGLDLTHAPLVQGENGVYFISLLPGGEREFTYRRAGSAASRIAPQDVHEDAVASSRAVLLSGITQAISTSAQAATLHAARLARRHGTLIALDPNYRPALWAERGGLNAARAALHDLLPFTDLLLPSFPADTALLGQPTPCAADAARAFAALVPHVALKAGANGAWLSDVGRVPAAPVPDVLDTTGAGDAWNGAYLHAVLHGAHEADAARRAHAVAAHAIRHRGAIPPRLHPPEIPA